VVVHVLQPDAREFYSLEELYEGCEELNWQEIALPELPEQPEVAQ
jgi:ribosomal silencing factor RsfS